MAGCASIALSFSETCSALISWDTVWVRLESCEMKSWNEELLKSDCPVIKRLSWLLIHGGGSSHKRITELAKLRPNSNPVSSFLPLFLLWSSCLSVCPHLSKSCTVTWKHNLCAFFSMVVLARMEAVADILYLPFLLLWLFFSEVFPIGGQCHDWTLHLTHAFTPSTGILYAEECSEKEGLSFSYFPPYIIADLYGFYLYSHCLLNGTSTFSFQ